MLSVLPDVALAFCVGIKCSLGQRIIVRYFIPLHIEHATVRTFHKFAYLYVTITDWIGQENKLIC